VSEASFISAAELLAHWQGHRRLTRRVIDAFPDDKLFTFSLGGMRPFGDLAMELLSMAVPAVKGVLSGDWQVASREGRASLTTSSSTSSTTKSIIAGRATCTCARSASSRRHSTSGSTSTENVETGRLAHGTIFGDADHFLAHG
jgi:hypothetical protein